MSHVVVNGPASWNTVVRLADLPEPSPHTVAATGYHDGLGGTSAGKAVTLAALGLPTTLVTTLGDDEAATRVLCALRAGRHGDRLRVVARHAVAGGTERHVNLVSDDGERVSLYLEQPTAPPPDEQGAIARDVDGWWEVGVADAGPVRATEGAGDAFLAGLLHGTLTGAPRAQALARAAATAALALTEPDVGAPHVDLERVERLARQVVVTRPA